MFASCNETQSKSKCFKVSQLHVVYFIYLRLSFDCYTQIVVNKVAELELMHGVDKLLSLMSV